MQRTCNGHASFKPHATPVKTAPPFRAFRVFTRFRTDALAVGKARGSSRAHMGAVQDPGSSDPVAANALAIVDEAVAGRAP